MKNKLFPLAILFLMIIVEPAFPQRINLVYKVMGKENDSLLFKGRAFSDRKIETKFESYFKNKKSKTIEIETIKDNINRKFEKITIKDTTNIYRVLNEGYYNLYMLESDNNPLFVVISKKDTIHIKKEDKIIETVKLKEDNRYRFQMKALTKDYPELFGMAEQLKYNDSQLQSFIYKLNGKLSKDNNVEYIAKPVRRFIHVNAMTRYEENCKYYTFNLLSSYYRLTTSSGMSFRYGLSANFLRQLVKFQNVYSLSERLVNGKIIIDSTLVYAAHQEKLNLIYYGIPLFLHYEFTEWYVTPYFYFGCAPTLVKRPNIDWEFKVDPFWGLGLKAKLTRFLNLMIETKSDFISGTTYSFGLDFTVKIGEH
jgi:hypothetical protein